MTPLKNIVFFKDQTTPATSAINYNAKADSLALEVTGSGSFKVVIEGQIDLGDNNWSSLAAINLVTATILTNGITAPGIYNIPIDSIQRYRARVESVNGSVTVFGRTITEEE